MTKPRRTLPTLTEVVELAVTEAAASEPLPLAPESVPLEPTAAPPSATGGAGLPRLSIIGHEEAARIVDAVVARLQPQLEAWLREQVMQAVQQGAQEALQEALRSHVDRAAGEVARRLRSELPSLARAALNAVRPDGFES